MRVVPAAVLLALSTAAAALETDFQDLRLSVGMASGFSSGEIRDAYLSGIEDPGYEGPVDWTPEPGLDLQLGPHLGQQIDEGFGLCFGADFVCRMPGGEGRRTVDQGGGSSRTDRFDLEALMFGAEFEAGMYWVAGPVRLELSPFIGAGYLRTRFRQSTTHVNPAPGITDQVIDYHDSGAYFSYGASVGVFVETVDWLLVGVNGGFLGSRATARHDQKGAEIADAEHVLEQNGWFAGGVLAWSF